MRKKRSTKEDKYKNSTVTNRMSKEKGMQPFSFLSAGRNLSILSGGRGGGGGRAGYEHKGKDKMRKKRSTKEDKYKKRTGQRRKKTKYKRILK